MNNMNFKKREWVGCMSRTIFNFDFWIFNFWNRRFFYINLLPIQASEETSRIVNFEPKIWIKWKEDSNRFIQTKTSLSSDQFPTFLDISCKDGSLRIVFDFNLFGEKELSSISVNRLQAQKVSQFELSKCKTYKC